MDVCPRSMDGFQTALTPDEPLLRRDRRAPRHRRRRAAGHRPGHGRGPAAAGHLHAWTPTSAIIMFAGIYYGGMYGGSTTSILLNTPGESSSVVTAIEGNKMAKSGRGRRRPSPPPPSARSWPAPSRTVARGIVRARSWREFAVELGPADVLRAHAAGLHHGDARCSARPRCAASPPLVLGLALGLRGHRPDHRASSGYTFGMPAAGSTASTSCVVAVAHLRGRRGALGRVPTCAASRCEIDPASASRG